MSVWIAQLPEPRRGRIVLSCVRQEPDDLVFLYTKGETLTDIKSFLSLSHFVRGLQVFEALDSVLAAEVR